MPRSYSRGSWESTVRITSSSARTSCWRRRTHCSSSSSATAGVRARRPGPLQPDRVHEGVQHGVALRLRDVLRAQEHLPAERGRALVGLDLTEPRVLIALIAEAVVGEHAAFDK